MVRLKRQAKLVTDAMVGIWSEQRDEDIRRVHNVLDLACGPGEWVMEINSAYPQVEVVGVDKSRRMIAYATAQAEAEDRSSCRFRVMDITQPLDFGSETFDLVNARFLLSFMKKEQWVPLLAECYRLLRPGGILRITDQESGFANDPTYQRYMDLWGSAWRAAGHAFAHTPAYIGVTVVLKQLMRQAGFVHSQHRPVSLDLSTGEVAHREILESLIQALRLASRFLLSLNVITEDEIDELSAHMERLIEQEGFCAYWFLQTVWARKPQTSEQQNR